MKPLLLLLTGLLIWCSGMAQYTATTIMPDGSQCALAKDAAGNIYAVRDVSGHYTVVKYVNGAGSPQVLNPSLELAAGGVEYPWGLAVNSRGDIYVTNPRPDDDWEIVKLTAPAYTSSVIQSGRFFSTLTVDKHDNIIAAEFVDPTPELPLSGDEKYQVVKYLSVADNGSGTVIYNGVPYQNDFSYPWSIVTDASDNIYFLDFVTNDPAPGTNFDGGRLIKLTAPAYNASIINTGKGIFTLATDASSNLYTVEGITPDFSKIVKYPAPVTATTSGETIYSELVNGSSFFPWGMVVNGGSIYVNDATDNPGTIEPNDGAFRRIDPPSISVLGVNRVGSSPTNAATVQYTVTFSGPATGVSVYAFTLTTTGSLMPFINSVSGSGTTYTVTVSTGSGDGAMRLDVNGTGISPTVTGTIPFTGQTFIIDNTAPVINDFKINNGATYTNSTAVTLNIEAIDALQMAFSNDGSTYSPFEAYAPSKAWTITPGDASKTVYIQIKDAAGNITTANAVITLDQNPPTGTAIISGPPAKTNSTTATFNFTCLDPTATFEASIDGGAYVGVTNPLTYTNLSTGSHNLNVRAKDAAGHLDPVPATYNWEIDQRSPVVAYVVPPVSGTYKDGAILTFKVAFSENIFYVGTPTLDVIIGSDTRKATLVAVNNEIATFTYQLQMPDTDDDGIALGAIELPAGSMIADLAGNPLTALSLNSVPSLSGVLVDTKHPGVTVSSTATFPVTGSFTINITFDEAITDDLTASDFTSINATISNVTKIDAKNWTALITPPPGQQNGSGSIGVLANTVHDAAGNGNFASNTLNDSWDTKAPALLSTSAPANGYYRKDALLSFTFTYDEDVIVTGAPILPITINGITSQMPYTPGADARTLAFNYTIPAGEQDQDGINIGAVELNGGSIKDVAGNNAGLRGPLPFPGIIVDGLPPVVNSVDVPAGGYYKAGQILPFVIHTSEGTTVTGTPTLDVIIGGIVRKASYTGAGGANTLNFVYTIVAGDNDMDGISLGSSINTNGSTIRDLAQNDIDLTLNNVGVTSGVFVNTVIPAVTLSSAYEGGLFSAPIPVTATFNDKVSGLTSASFSCTNCTVNSLTNPSGDGMTYQLIVSGNAFGAINIQLPAGAVQNIGNNDNTASNTIVSTYDNVRPFVNSITVTPKQYKLGDIIQFNAQLSERCYVSDGFFLSFNVGSTPEHANVNVGLSDAEPTAVFEYQVKAGDYDNDGIVLTPPVINLNGGNMHDVAGNTIDPAIPAGSLAFSGIVIDGVVPVVTSVSVPSNGYHHAGDPLTFIIHTSENVSITGTPTLEVKIGGVSKQAVMTGGNGTNALGFTYTVQTGDNDMNGIELGALQLNSGTIQDAAGNNMELTLNGAASTNGVFVNTIVPSVTLSTANALVNGGFDITATFSEAVTGLTTGDFIATNATLSNLRTSDNIVYTLTVTPAANPVTLQLPAGIALNNGMNGNLFSNTLTVNYDGAAPVITAVDLPPTGTYKAGDVLNFVITFNENVIVTGTPFFNVVLSSGSQPATYAGNDGANHLTFSYTVQANDADFDGITLGSGLELDAGNTVKDIAGNTANPVLNGISANIVKIDAVPPVITLVDVPGPGYYTTGQPLQFQVHFSELVNLSGTPTLDIVIGATTRQAILTGSNNKDFTFRYIVQAGEMDIDGITISGFSANGSVRDGVGNDADLTLQNAGNTSGVLVYTAVPTVTISGAINLHGAWTAAFTFSEKMSGFDLSDILATNATMSNLQTSDNITYTAQVTPTADGAVSISVPANAATNVAGIYNSVSNGVGYTYDGTAPVIVSADGPAGKYYTTNAALDFIVHYTEAVYVNGVPIFPITVGDNTVQASYISGSGSNELLFRYTVQNGDMDLDGITTGTTLLLNSSSIQDAAGNDAVPTLNNMANTSQVRINTGHPAVQIASAAATRVNAPFQATVTFSEEVSGFTVADVTAINATIGTPQTSDNITYTITVTPMVDGEVSLSIPAAVAANKAGNDNTASGLLSRTYDHTAPVIIPPTFDVNNNAATGTLVGKITATDVSGTLQDWAIVTDGSDGAFEMDANGNITVKDPAILDKSAGAQVIVTVKVSDGLNTSIATPVSINVLLAYVNKTPTLAKIGNESICEGTDAHTIQLTGASAADPDQTYTITATSDQPYFDVLEVSAANVLTYQLKSNVNSAVATITVTIKDNGGTANGAKDEFSQTFTVTVNSLPTIVINSDKGASISKGDIVHLTATGGNSYAWTNADGILSGQRSSMLEVRPMTSVTYEITATTTAGCSSTATFDIAVVEDFKVDATNILTPNGDGRNDKWVIRNLDSYPDNEVSIFDRSGRLIYHRINYSNDWDGTFNGSPLGEGTYYYILKIRGTSKIAKGYITIVRNQK